MYEHGYRRRYTTCLYLCARSHLPQCTYAHWVYANVVARGAPTIDNSTPIRQDDIQYRLVTRYQCSRYKMNLSDDIQDRSLIHGSDTIKRIFFSSQCQIKVWGQGIGCRT